MRLIFTGMAALCINGLASAQGVEGVVLGQSRADLERALTGQCAEREDIAIDPTNFPFARMSEHHIRCQAQDREIMYTLCDDALVQVEVRGIIQDILPANNPDYVLDHLQIYFDPVLIHDTQTSRLLYLKELELATSLPFWSNPAWQGEPTHQSADWHLPDGLVWGASIAEIEASFADRCAVIDVQAIDEVWLMTQPSRQDQMNCYGFDLANYPRKIEFVFGDGALEQIWLLLGPGDVERARAAYTEIYGAPVFENEQYIGFDNLDVIIRKDKSELLLGSPRLRAIWREEFL
ncbi:hypothetical protein [Woodsholea maritima]|uniref:hypothetical protein n=1 Tax=Woodsholea maritima TaxID=240237 RepID=UPI00036AA1EA|nr:hypothetical protein [Woodsholea maritima]